MKKRSLVAALAMLVVSAIVLTSSTYAWFATGTTAKVSGISAYVSNESGNITISADGTEYSTSLEYAKFQGQAGNFTPGTFQPVSFDPINQAFIAGSIRQQDDDPDNALTYGKLLFEPSVATNDSSKFIKMKVYVKSSVDCTVNVAADMAGSTYQFIYAAVYEDDNTSNYKVYNTASRTYVPVLQAKAGIDVDTNGIMEKSIDKLADGTGDYDSALATDAVASTTSDVVSISLTKDTPKTITLYVWAEGNDKLCVGSIDYQSCAVALNFTKV